MKQIDNGDRSRRRYCAGKSIAWMTALAAVLASCEGSPPAENSATAEQHGIPAQRSAGGQPALASINRPSVPPPKFRLYRYKFEAGGADISYVVPTNTTDEQLKSLLWLIREKVRSRRFRDIGITQPTDSHWGKKDYDGGMLSIYRGEKCANEVVVIDPANLPCGQGGHDAAFYQWGIFGDNPNDGINPDKDAAGIMLANGNLLKVFDYKDGWKPRGDQ